MFKESIGKKSKKIKNVVERGAAAKFASAIGDESPIYLDEAAGGLSVHKRNIAPVTFPVTFQYGNIPGIEMPIKGLIHGEQRFRYERPLAVGETVYCYTEVKDYYLKKGNFGEMGFLVLARIAEDESGQRVYESESVLILNDALRKELSV